MNNPNFRGFADFANASGSTTAAVLAAARSKKQSAPSDQSKPIFRPSPIYTGTDQRLVVLFRKIGQKRDATTKIRALDELVSGVFAKGSNEYTRPEKIASLCHLVFLHEIKLGYDNNPSVRATSYKALVACKPHVPKAWNGLFLGENGETVSASNTVGLAWASRCDPSAEVVRYANEFVKLLSQDSQDMSDTMQMGVLSYSQMVLGCKRASALQDVINPVSSSSFTSSTEASTGKEKKKGTKASAKNSETAAALAESEREEMEERYERVMVAVLNALGSFVEGKPETALPYAAIENFPESTSITRLMQGSRASFRRESYNLVSKFCQFGQSLVLPSIETSSKAIIPLANLIPTLISAEKDSSNFIALLELVLSFLSISRGKSTGSNDPWETIDAAAFVKSLSKVLRKACYGAPATHWGQMILPIVASLPCGDDMDHALPVIVLESLWEGRKSALVVMDTVSIVSAVVECVTYLLLRRPKESSTFTPKSCETCAQLFLDCISYFFNEAPASVGPAAHSLNNLCLTIAREITRLDVASTDNGARNRGIDQIESFLWGDSGMQRIISGERDRQTDVKLTHLMDNIIESQNKGQLLSHTLLSCKILFHEIIINSNSRDKNICTKEEVGLLFKIIQICGAQTLFPIQMPVESLSGIEEISLSLEDFCVNNLIRWILIHAKTAPLAIPDDFKIVKCLLLLVQSAHHQKQIWETILRELFKSHCDVTTLATGLCAMISDEMDNSVVNLVKCHTLDQFAIDVSNTFIDKFWLAIDLSHNSADGEEDLVQYQDMSSFFKSCLGLYDRGSVIVSTSVIKHWVDQCCDETKNDDVFFEDELGSNALLETLLMFGTSCDDVVLNQNDLAKLIIESWRQGGPIWEKLAINGFDIALDSANKKFTLRNKIISQASSSLEESIRRKASSDHAILELRCQSWSKKAKRLLDISKESNLKSIGINVDLFKRIYDQDATELLFLSLMYLFHDIDSPSRCRELLLTKSHDYGLFVEIQSSITDPVNPLVESFHRRTQRNNELVEVLGGPTKLDNCAEDLVTKCIEILASYLKDPTSSTMQRNQTLTTLSYMVSHLYPAKWSEMVIKDDFIVAEDIKKGDFFWYEKSDGRRVKSKVLKVHTDDFPNFYFTIKEEGKSEERQTIASRLKQNPVAPSEILQDKSDEFSREKMALCMMDLLIKPYLPNLKNEVSAECLNIIISQIGLINVGIGSTRYEIVQIMASLQQNLFATIPDSEESIEQSASILRCITLAMGYGVFTKAPPLGQNILEIKFAVDGIFTYILNFYEEQDQFRKEKCRAMESFHCAVAMWLSIATVECNDGEILRRLSSRIILFCDALLWDFSADKSILLMKAVVAFQISCKKCCNYSSVDMENEIKLFEKITKCFIEISDGDTTLLWTETYRSVLQYFAKEMPGVIVHVAGTFYGDLIECLKSSEKQWCAFQLLMMHAKKHVPTGSIDDIILPPLTKSLLTEWKDELDEDKATDLEDDLRSVSFWVSESLIHLIHNMGISAENDKLEMSYLLSWILFIEIFDKSGAVDMRNRSSMCILMQKSNVISAIMDIALKEANLEMSRKENIFDCISCTDERDMFVLKEVATLAVYRTIESVPTLAKLWYNDDCPRYLQQKVMSFVENKVAPETLQHELVRIKDATSFGEMTVSGSAISREVVAKYHQDECLLSVTIRVPSAFPLRNVEVDLAKTLGIAEKRWRRWSLNIMMMLNNQDGSILDALLLWKENVDREFEGVEPCPVCYSVLCIKTHSMPNLQCKTCNNKFHSLCLHKWFQSSGKSNCVLCQQPWSGTKVV